MKTLQQLSSELLQHEQQVDAITFDKINVRPGQLVVVGSRPAIGKTTFLLYLLQLFAEQFPTDECLFFTNHETEERIYSKFAAQVSGRPANKINGILEEVIHGHPSILTSSAISMVHMIGDSKAQMNLIRDELSANKNLKVLFVDSLQGLTLDLPAKKRKDKTNQFLAEFKQLARKNNLLVILSCRLSRSVDRREGHRPALEDFRGTSQIEEQCDVVLALHRPAYYTITEDENGNSLVDVMEVAILKNRNGRCFDFQYRFKTGIPRVSHVLPEN